MSRLRLCPPRDTIQKDIFQYKELKACSHVFLRGIATALPLTAPYDGPYKVISRSGRIMKILMKSKVQTVSVDRVKPAHFECEPDTGTEIKCTTQQKTTHSKTAWLGRESNRIRGQRNSLRRVAVVRVRQPLYSSKRLEHTCLDNTRHI